MTYRIPYKRGERFLCRETRVDLGTHQRYRLDHTSYLALSSVAPRHGVETLSNEITLSDEVGSSLNEAPLRELHQVLQDGLMMLPIERTRHLTDVFAERHP